MRAFTTHDLNKQVGEVTDAATKSPIVITRHRKPRFVMMSYDHYQKIRNEGDPAERLGPERRPTPWRSSSRTSSKVWPKASATTMSVELRPGDLVSYPYLWRWQQARGETEGRKDRPVCVVVAARGVDGLTHLALLAISSRQPGADQVAIEVPEIECRRGGLSDLKRAWVTVSEYNYDIAERSFYLDASGPILGRFSRSFMMQLAGKVASLFRAGDARVDRAD